MENNIADKLKRLLEEHPKAALDFGSQMMYNDEKLSIVGDIFGSKTIVVSKVDTGEKLFVGSQKGSAVNVEGDWVAHVDELLSQIDNPEASSGQGQSNIEPASDVVEDHEVGAEPGDGALKSLSTNPNGPEDSGVTPANGLVTPATDKLPKQESKDPLSHPELPKDAAWPA